MNYSDPGELDPTLDGSTKEDVACENLNPEVKEYTNEDNDVAGGSNNRRSGSTLPDGNDTNSSKLTEDEYDFSKIIDYDVEYLDESEEDDYTADPLLEPETEPGTSNPSKRVSKFGHFILYNWF